MNTEQAINAINTHLEHYMQRVPKALLNNIERIINQTRTIIKREVILPQRNTIAPDLNKEWKKICDFHKVDPVKAKKTREQDVVSVRAHFVRHILLHFENVTVVKLATFLGKDHSTIIHLRDRSKSPCPIPPLRQKKVILE